jgi:predicted site-specific integrase-resolvase
MTGNRMSDDLMTRRQVAVLFRATSAAVATWARRGRLPEVRDETGRPRYRRTDVEALFRSDVGRRAQ